MEAFLLYNLKVALVLTVFYLFWRRCFRRLTLHRLNRAFLVGILPLSCLLPFCVRTFRQTMPLSTVTQVSDLFPQSHPLVAEVFNFQPLEHNTPWMWLLMPAYTAGALWMLVRLILSVRQTMRLIRSGELLSSTGGERILVSDTTPFSFSWFRFIVLSRPDLESGRQEIIDHERTHVRLHHSLDLSLVDLFAVFQWFNPLMRLLRADLSAVHEYQADAAVLRSVTDPKAYQFLLVQKAAARLGFTIANPFSGTILQERVRMMTQPASSASHAWRLLGCLPLLALVLLANAQVQTRGFNNLHPPILVFEGKTISLEEVEDLQDQLSGTVTTMFWQEASRVFGLSVPGGVIQLDALPARANEDGKVSFRLIPGFNVSDPQAYPLLIVNGVEFPYERRREFLSDQWAWKWHVFLQADQSQRLYGDKARNGAFILNLVRK